jgi:pimeloyl-ACP methyl ester carboxylesterase
MADLIKIRGCDRPDRQGDVIFVHGLNGNPRAYWCSPGEPDKFWPAWLGEDVSEVGVWSLGYENAALTQRRWSLARIFLQGGFAMSLVERADNVLLELVSKGIGERPLVFITHSMGGLLVKQVLRTANDSTDSRRRAIVDQARGICFIATPHIGADPAKWASYFGKLLGTTVAMEELKSHAPYLLNLNQWYRNFVSGRHHPIKTLSFYEKKPMRVIGLVVEEGDADPGVPHAGLHPLDEDHISICKPGSKNPQIHEGVREFIRRDCLRLDDVQPQSGRSSPRKKPDIPTAQKPSAVEAIDNKATKEKKRTPPKQKKPPLAPARLMDRPVRPFRLDLILGWAGIHPTKASHSMAKTRAAGKHIDSVYGSGSSTSLEHSAGMKVKTFGYSAVSPRH